MPVNQYGSMQTDVEGIQDRLHSLCIPQQEENALSNPMRLLTALKTSGKHNIDAKTPILKNKVKGHLQDLAPRDLACHLSAAAM